MIGQKSIACSFNSLFNNYDPRYEDIGSFACGLTFDLKKKNQENNLKLHLKKPGQPTVVFFRAFKKHQQKKSNPYAQTYLITNHDPLTL